MPSKSAKQHRLMALVANDPKAAKRLGISQSVGRDFMKADKGRKFGSGGSMKESKAMMRKEVAFMKKKGAPKSMIRHEEKEAGMKKDVKKFQGGGSSYVRRSGPTTREATGPTSGRATYFPNPFGKSIKVYTGPTGGNYPRQFTKNPRDIFGNENPNYSDYEATKALEELRENREPIQNRKGGQIKSKGGFRRQADGVAHKGKTKGRVVKMAGGGMAYSSGGSVYRKGADGIASKGKTKGRMVKMAYGGKC